MYHSAQYYFSRVVKQGGPSSPYFTYALPKLVAIAQVTATTRSCLRLVDDIPPDAFPRAARNQLSYLLGIQRYEKDDLAGASKYFGQVSTKSSMYLKAKYFEGVIANQQEKQKQAVRAFIEVYNDGPSRAPPDEVAEVDRLKDLSSPEHRAHLLQHPGLPEGQRVLRRREPQQRVLAEALFENAWAYFMQNDLNVSLGKLLTIQSSFFDNDEFLPEATILQALTYFNLLRVPEVEHELLRFEGQYRPMADELKGFVQRLRARPRQADGRPGLRLLLRRASRVDSVLPKSLFRRALRNQDLAALVEAPGSDGQGRAAHRRPEGAVAELRRQQAQGDHREGPPALQAQGGCSSSSRKMARTYQYLQDLLTQSEIIRFEVVDAQRVDYQYKMQNTELAKFRGEHRPRLRARRRTSSTGRSTASSGRTSSATTSTPSKAPVTEPPARESARASRSNTRYLGRTYVHGPREGAFGSIERAQSGRSEHGE
jgi:hypothetical protein